MNKFIFAIIMFLFACGGVDDLNNPDNFPIQVTRYTDDNGVEHVEEKQLPFDYDLYGQAQQALSTAPPSRFGESSAVSVGASDTRCPVGGFTSGTNYCDIPGTKHINWDTSAFDHSHDAEFGVDVPNYVRLGLAQAAQDALPTGFSQERDNTSRSFGGTIRWATCSVGFMCTNWTRGPVVLAGGQRIRQSIGTGFTVSVDPVKLLNDIRFSTNTQKAFTIMNFTAHELGHTEGNGHVPVAENSQDVMNLETGNTGSQQKHLSSAEVSRMTSWFATF